MTLTLRDVVPAWMVPKSLALKHEPVAKFGIGFTFYDKKLAPQFDYTFAIPAIPLDQLATCATVAEMMGLTTARVLVMSDYRGGWLRTVQYPGMKFRLWIIDEHVTNQPRQCQGITITGERCKLKIRKGPYCANHQAQSSTVIT